MVNQEEWGKSPVSNYNFSQEHPTPQFDLETAGQVIDG
jgi:hypothetical protein